MAGTRPAIGSKGCVKGAEPPLGLQWKSEPDSRGLVPAIRALLFAAGALNVGGRNKSGHGGY
jgi:hypothetical protein